MSLLERRIPLEHAHHDAKVFRVLEELTKWVRDIARVVNDSVDTSPVQGVVRVRAPLVPGELAADPRQVSAFGRLGEVRRFGGLPFIKQGVEGSDTDWEQLAGQTAVENLIVVQATEPPSLADSAPFWVNSALNPWMLHMLTSFDGGLNHEYDATPFVYYSTTMPTASRTSPGRFVDLSANPSVHFLKLQKGTGSWYYARQGQGSAT